MSEYQAWIVLRVQSGCKANTLDIISAIRTHTISITHTLRLK